MLSGSAPDRWKRAASALGALLLAVLVACGPGSAGGQSAGAARTPTPGPVAAQEPQPLRVGLSAATSGGAAASGEAIQRGIQLAIDEINGQGGINGRPLELVVRDHGGDPAKGAANVRELVEGQRAVAVFGGAQTPVALAEADTAQQLQVPYLVPWATGTRIVQSDRRPSFAFRVSANDRGVDRFLVSYLTRGLARQSPALFVEDSPRGEADLEILTQSLAEAGLRPAAVERLQRDEADLAPRLSRARDAGFDSLVLVADPVDGAQILRDLAKLGLDPGATPVVTHLGLAGREVGPLAETANDVRTVQTYSFFGEQNIPGKRVSSGYLRKYGGKGPEDITAPVGVANAFDALHLLARALRQASDPTSGEAVRQALEDLQTPYEGLIKTYQRPFTPDSHEALSPDDYLMAVWKDGQLLPERVAAR